MHTSRNRSRHERNGAIQKNEKIHLPCLEAVGRGDKGSAKSQFLKHDAFLTRSSFLSRSIPSSTHKIFHSLNPLKKSPSARGAGNRARKMAWSAPPFYLFILGEICRYIYKKGFFRQSSKRGGLRPDY
jgi:hypothetical protein